MIIQVSIFVPWVHTCSARSVSPVVNLVLLLDSSSYFIVFDYCINFWFEYMYLCKTALVVNTVHIKPLVLENSDVQVTKVNWCNTNIFAVQKSISLEAHYFFFSFNFPSF